MGPAPADEQQRTDADGDRHEDGDLAQRVEAAEVDQNHVDDVVAVGQRGAASAK